MNVKLLLNQQVRDQLNIQRGLLVLVFFLLSAFGAQAQTVTSDKDDYAPGEIATITGSGWTQDQMVHVEFKEEPDYPDYHVYDVVVDEEGKWEIKYQIETRHIGVKFTITAVGKQSGALATAVFTDGNVRIRTSRGTISVKATRYQNSTSCGGTGGTAVTTNNVDTDNPGEIVIVANIRESAFISIGTKIGIYMLLVLCVTSA